MYQNLQRNFDVIQYLCKNASPEQLAWCKHEQSSSLGEVICDLCDDEISYMYLLAEVLPHSHPAAEHHPEIYLEITTGSPTTINHEQIFARYSDYRQSLIKTLAPLSQAQWQAALSHQQFGALTVRDLAERIDECDRRQIKKIEEIIHHMPLNPLMSRALYEIAEYHRRYRPYLNGAASLLDIGVGTGLALRHVMEQNPHLTFAGVDIRDLRLPSIYVPLQVYDGGRLPFADHQFDVALLFYVLHHCQDAHHLLNEAVRVTRQKVIVIEEFSRAGVDETSLDLTERQSHRALGLPPDLYYQLFDQPELEAMFAARGLTLLERQPLPSKTTRPVQKYLYVLQVGTV